VTPQSVTITDVSTGSDGSITGRRVYIQDGNGNYIVPVGTTTPYVSWAYSNPSITLNSLTQDTAASITVFWVDINGNTLYQYGNTYPLSEFGKQFFYYLIQLQGLSPNTYQDANYASNLSLFWANIVAGDNAVTYGNDIKAAQQCYNREILMQQNQSIFFK
jgi:hypothetical protein